MRFLLVDFGFLGRAALAPNLFRFGGWLRGLVADAVAPAIKMKLVEKMADFERYAVADDLPGRQTEDRQADGWLLRDDRVPVAFRDEQGIARFDACVVAVRFAKASLSGDGSSRREMLTSLRVEPRSYFTDWHKYGD